MEEDEIFLEEDLTMDWIKDFEKMYSLNTFYPKEKMEKISIYYLYVENEMIVKMCKKSMIIDHSSFIDQLKRKGYEGLDGFRKEWLLKSTDFITNDENRVKEWNQTQEDPYFLTDILFFNMELDPEKIQSFSEISIKDASDQMEPFFHSFTCFVSNNEKENTWGDLDKECYLNDSVFLFHCLNAVFFLYRKNTIEQKMKSIMVWKRENGLDNHSSIRKTKRVQFYDSESNSDSDSESNSDSDSDHQWDIKKWIKHRKKNKTQKRKHSLNSTTIRQLFSH
jgi:hypothetical protein